ncbi:hypothetical protein KI387_001183, partial [Taxus chinensis]
MAAMIFNAVLQFSALWMVINAGLGDAKGTKVGFYSSSCPKAESIVAATVKTHFDGDQTIAAGILRLFFHDCFVQGCDASILITGASTEKNSLTNLGLRGFDVVEDAKAKIEAACKGVVSCADILALAARDAVVLSKGPTWDVPTGRRDGLVSSSSDAANLPTPADSVSVQKQKFADKGLTAEDLVTLVVFQLQTLQLHRHRKCGSEHEHDISERGAIAVPCWCDGSKRVALDKGSQMKFDESFFKNVRDGKRCIGIDQRLWGDASTKTVVQKYAGTIRGLLGVRFDLAFAKAMVKMGNIGVKTGTDGEIRSVCSSFN